MEDKLNEKMEVIISPSREVTPEMISRITTQFEKHIVKVRVQGSYIRESVDILNPLFALTISYMTGKVIDFLIGKEFDAVLKVLLDFRLNEKKPTEFNLILYLDSGKEVVVFFPVDAIEFRESIKKLPKYLNQYSGGSTTIFWQQEIAKWINQDERWELQERKK